MTAFDVDLATRRDAFNFYKTPIVHTDQSESAPGKVGFIELNDFITRNFWNVPDRSKVRILDLGCGCGRSLRTLTGAGYDVWGIDFSKASIMVCEEVLAHDGQKAELKVGDMAATAYPHWHFDAAIDLMASHCLEDWKYDMFLGEVARILKPGGMFFSLAPGKNSDDFIRAESLIGNVNSRCPEDASITSGVAPIADIRGRPRSV